MEIIIQSLSDDLQEMIIFLSQVDIKFPKKGDVLCGVLEMTRQGSLVVTETAPQPQQDSILPNRISSRLFCQSVLEQNTVLGRTEPQDLNV